MAGIKGMKGSGGYREGSGRKNLSRTVSMTFKISEEERELIKRAKGDLSLTDFLLKCIKEREDD
ncbi:MAG: hypothetical protein ACRCX2_36565 [Paraclostridium sp.]